MPQMAPIWWTTMFMLFNLMYMYYMINTYFFISYEKKNEMKKKLNLNNKNWMW